MLSDVIAFETNFSSFAHIYENRIWLVLAVLLNFILKLTDASLKVLYNQKNFF